ncbi:NADH:ubiquinone reductase (Na(+)-transporting) subunit B [Blastopirellula retiformator]|uniref:Na(+)-translocating NADH-quinone reductase subunit B n=1 Tax=Blastopirellula retiformator TaxID=2527970 RepID=A0A5C5VPH5_9BACT|nr:NADH:ubiquinone reductase (Na(+)-transporting) subunit B [Blastopirellula retiformator]TWT39532.1 Na(+)-translocating NADH-quinone reductase subunit B [Blastopirellula retiformator]
MKFLRKMLDSAAPMFEEGGKFERLYPLYEAGDTFLFTPGEVTHGSTHVRDGLDLKRMMVFVVIALTPCILMAMWNTGYQANSAIHAEAGTAIESWQESVFTSLGMTHDPNSFLANIILGAIYFLPVYIVTMTVGGIIEVTFGIIRGHEVNEGFLVTGMLFPLTLPPTIPLWQVALGIAFGVLIGKEVFGGTGKNFLNPALTARAFLYFAYPNQITGNVWVAADGFSGATTLGALAENKDKADVALGTVLQSVDGHGISWMDAFLGTITGSMGETSALACLLGAAFLILTGVGSWKIMAATVLGAVGTSGAFYLASLTGLETSALFALPPWWHLVVGGFAFGCVFMVTDPVSAAMTEKGKWFYGILVGVLTILIRGINPAFPEGIMLAILFGNMTAPLIDYFVIQGNINRRMARYAVS